MKLNMKYCLIGLFLISIIIFSCLGNNLYEGLINENQVRENTYKSGDQYAKKEGKEYQHLINSQGFNQENNTNMIQHSENDFNSRNNLGSDVDQYGCKPSAGEHWCEEKQQCVQNWDQNCNKKHHKHHKHHKDKSKDESKHHYESKVTKAKINEVIKWV